MLNPSLFSDFLGLVLAALGSPHCPLQTRGSGAGVVIAVERRGERAGMLLELETVPLLLPGHWRALDPPFG